MKNRQLMRLNKVLHNGEIKTIDCIAIGHVSFVEDIPRENGARNYGKWIALDEVEFIPITEEWLLKLGFKRSETSADVERVIYYSKSKLTICDWGDGKLIMSNAFAHGIRIELIHVHQLQNLYFVIINEELIIE